jgi:hypothetical protein
MEKLRLCLGMFVAVLFSARAPRTIGAIRE